MEQISETNFPPQELEQADDVHPLRSMAVAALRTSILADMASAADEVCFALVAIVSEDEFLPLPAVVGAI